MPNMLQLKSFQNFITFNALDVFKRHEFINFLKLNKRQIQNSEANPLKVNYVLEIQKPLVILSDYIN